MQHHFSIEIAKKHGVNEAIFLENIAYWTLHNKANEKHFYKNRYWTYNTQKSFENLFPYWSRQNLRTVIKSCTNQELIIKDNFNKSNYDHTTWYALTDKGLDLFNNFSTFSSNQPIELLKSTNQSECGLQGNKLVGSVDNKEWLEPTTLMVETNHAIPDINTYRKQKIKDNKAKTKKTSSRDSEKIDLPDWLNEQLWEDFKQHRKELKKPMTMLAQKKMINQLFKLKEKGQDIEFVINNSIANGWQGIFEIKSQKDVKNGNQYSRHKTAAEIVWERSTSGLPEFENFRRNKEISSDSENLCSATEFLF